MPGQGPPGGRPCCGLANRRDGLKSRPPGAAIVRPGGRSLYLRSDAARRQGPFGPGAYPGNRFQGRRGFRGLPGPVQGSVSGTVRRGETRGARPARFRAGPVKDETPAGGILLFRWGRRKIQITVRGERRPPCEAERARTLPFGRSRTDARVPSLNRRAPAGEDPSGMAAHPIFRRSRHVLSRRRTGAGPVDHCAHLCGGCVSVVVPMCAVRAAGRTMRPPFEGTKGGFIRRMKQHLPASGCPGGNGRRPRGRPSPGTGVCAGRHPSMSQRRGNGTGKFGL